ncbi:hypothetical protein PybrP1_010067 [[Pythium] brassicae (nom. inval.)]|nr:hypothetical protein PybrP1_010067 [[Pythium] brassicae (nom. inval.)]
MASLAILRPTRDPAGSRQRGTGRRERYTYCVPFVERACRPGFLACFQISVSTLARYKRLVQAGYWSRAARRCQTFPIRRSGAFVRIVVDQPVSARNDRDHEAIAELDRALCADDVHAEIRREEHELAGVVDQLVQSVYAKS